MNIATRFHKCISLPWCAVAVLLVPVMGHAAETDLATAPLITAGTAGSSVKPNLFFILDNSGSMNWDYLPDWVVDSTWCKGSAGTASLYCCRNSSGSNITSSSTSSTCLPQSSSGTNLDGGSASYLRGMPPFHSPDFNSVYYNPAITYSAPYNADGTQKTSYSGSGSVPWDGYSVQYTSTQTNTLTSGFPDVEWCTDNTYSNCLRNDNYLLPGTVGGNAYTTMHAVTTGTGTTSFATGTPTAPTAATGVSVGPYYYAMVPGEYCTTPKLSDCTYATGQTTVGSKTYLYPATLRWCNNSAGRVAGESGAGSSDVCQAVKNATYRYPRYPTLKLSNAVSGVSATGKLTVAALPDSGNTTGVNAACTAVAASSKSYISSIKLNGTEILTTPFTYCDGSNTSSTRNNNFAEQIRSRIGNGFSATRSNAVLTITTPAGADYNGATLVKTITTATLTLSTAFANGVTAVGALYVPGSFKRINIVSGATFSNWCLSSAGALTEITSSTCSGTMVVDRSNRTDCAAPTCTYAQELANFANWFAWYRSRMQMAKSALSISFQSIDDRYRVGLFTINNSSSNLVNIAPFAAGASGQKSTWFTKLFAANPDGGTPLRVALSNAGRIYAGQTAITGATDPVQYSCQKNYTILSTDGYWNGSNGVDLSGSEILNADSSGMVIGGITGPFADTYEKTLADVAGYYYKTDLRPEPCTDSKCADDVPTLNEDKNTQQHMVTYTIGLGIDGVMKYRDNYTTTTTEVTDDYSAVKDGTTANPTQGICPWQTSGTCKWPDPNTSSGSEVQERIDDLWHAAVNGHGKYYSARDALALSRGLSDALSGIGKDDGGGAAATTSNPNVTTGDNFVFSSKYWTSDWTGELYRETMNTTSGIITYNATKDWKAHDKLDAASWSSRPIYTFNYYGGTPRNFEWSSLTSSGSTCNPPGAEQGCFTSPYITSGLAQFCTIGPLCLSSGDKVTASGQNLVYYLRGDKTYEDTTSDTRFYRERKHRLGDIVNSEAVYVGKYLYDYGFGATNGYPVRGTTRANPTVYVAANDGMLHAFDAQDAVGYEADGTTVDPTITGGTERWAYVPSMVIKDLFRLADKDYATRHRYFVDGSPVTGDVQVTATTWKTILVGGLAGGGAGYYALDITDQTAPKVLWEFRQSASCTATTPPSFTLSGMTMSGSNEVTGLSDTTSLHVGATVSGAGIPAGTTVESITSATAITLSVNATESATTALTFFVPNRMTEDCDLGYSYGNPIITKLPSGTWVVIVTSGYNNNSTGDGEGHLYILNALNGTLMGKVSTGVGDTTTPSGLGKINAWVENAMLDNTSKYVYGGDLLGNMWKFDLTGCSTSTTSCSPVVSLLINVDPVGTATKPITAKPELGEVVKSNGQKKRVVFFPTGSLLGNSDLAVTDTQSFYGIWDKDSSPPTTLVSATATGGSTGDRTGNVIGSVFETDTNLGWQMDFPSAGERGNTDPQLAFGTLIFATNKPGTADACNPSGFSSWVYNLDYLSGGAVKTASDTTNTGLHLATYYSGASTRPNVVVLPSGTVKSITRTTGQDVVNNVEDVRIKAGGGGVRRVTWRELLN